MTRDEEVLVSSGDGNHEGSSTRFHRRLGDTDFSVCSRIEPEHESEVVSRDQAEAEGLKPCSLCPFTLEEYRPITDGGTEMAATSADGELVLVSRGRIAERYHRRLGQSTVTGCGNVDLDQVEILPRDEAEAEGYTACGNCSFPERVDTDPDREVVADGGEQA